MPAGWAHRPTLRYGTALRDRGCRDAVTGSGHTHPGFLRELDGFDPVVLEDYDERDVTHAAGNIGGETSRVDPHVGIQHELRFTHLVEHARAGNTDAHAALREQFIKGDTFGRQS